MPISTWIRDILGIRKDIVDTKKSELEIEKLEAERQARNLITPATMDDVKEYDPKLKRFLEKMRDEFEEFEDSSIHAELIVVSLPWN